MSVNKERAWDLLKRLSFVRVTGTAAEKDAAAILLNECKDAGVRAEVESFEIDDYQTYKAEFEVLEPFYQQFDVIAMGRSGSTPEEGLVAGFKYVENGNDVNLTDVKDKIVLIQGRVFGPVVEKLIKAGAAGYILIAGKFYEDESIKKEVRPSMTRGDKKLPAVKMHIEQAEKLVLAKPTKVRMTLSQLDRTGVSQNVVATIEGTDLKDETVIFSAHYDSVEYSKGAWDNATGAVNVMELMHYFNANRPRRTVKFLWCGAEEIGCVGSRKYCEKHQDELGGYIYNINFDMTGCTIGYEQFTCTANQEIIDGLKYLANLEQYPVNTTLGNYSSDSASFAANGIPACTFARLAPNGGAEIHNHNDIIDRLDPDSFMITLDFVVKYSEQIINSTVNLIPRRFDEKITKELDELKKRFG